MQTRPSLFRLRKFVRKRNSHGLSPGREAGAKNIAKPCPPSRPLVLVNFRKVRRVAAKMFAGVYLICRLSVPISE